jgi:hypothetical protein
MIIEFACRWFPGGIYDTKHLAAQLDVSASEAAVAAAAASSDDESRDARPPPPRGSTPSQAMLQHMSLQDLFCATCQDAVVSEPAAVGSEPASSKPPTVQHAPGFEAYQRSAREVLSQRGHTSTTATAPASSSRSPTSSSSGDLGVEGNGSSSAALTAAHIVLSPPDTPTSTISTTSSGLGDVASSHPPAALMSSQQQQQQQQGQQPMSAAHEAGFDAFMTGAVFACLTHRLGRGGSLGAGSPSESQLLQGSGDPLAAVVPHRWRIRGGHSVAYYDVAGADPVPHSPSLFMISGLAPQVRTVFGGDEVAGVPLLSLLSLLAPFRGGKTEGQSELDSCLRVHVVC